MPASQVFVYHHTHWDREWYHPFRTYQVRLAEVVDRVLDKLDSHELEYFTLDGQTVLLEDYLELRPENRSRLEGHIRSGRISIGPWYVSPDEFLVSGESVIRNLQRGIRMSEAWGCKQFTGYLPDNFGHVSDMPTIFKQFGIDTAIVWRGADPIQFWWESRTGDRVLTYTLAEGYFQNMLHDNALSFQEKEAALKGLAEKLAAASPLALVPVGGDHLGPIHPEENAALKSAFPKAETTPDQFMPKLLESLNGTQLPVQLGVLRDNRRAFLLSDVWSARVYLKQANRRLEHRLTREIEPQLALAQLFTPPARYPASELDIAWKQLLLNHPHDSICGCSADPVHRENEVRFDQVAQLCEALGYQARHALNVTHAGPNQWLILNQSDAGYTGVVPAVEYSLDSDTPSLLHQLEAEVQVLQDDYLADVTQVPMSDRVMYERRGWIWAENIPAQGYAVIARDFMPEYHAIKVGQQSLESDRFKVEVGQDGLLTITDHQSGQTYSGLHQLTDQPDCGDSYTRSPAGEVVKAIFNGSSVELAGPLVGRLKLNYTLPGMPMTTIVQLQAGSPFIELETTFTNTLPDHRMQVGFSTGQPVREAATEGYFGLDTRSHDPDYSLQADMPVASQKELISNTGPLQRFVSANGHSLLTEGLQEYEVAGETLFLTLHRGFSAISKGDTGVRGAQAGPPFPTPEGQCLGRTFSLRYTWLPTPDNPHMLYLQADRFFGAVSAQQGRGEIDQPASVHSLLTWDSPAIISTSLTWMTTPHRGLRARLVNTTGQPQKISFQPGFSCSSAWQLDFLDRARTAEASQVASFAPYEVKTVLFCVQ